MNGQTYHFLRVMDYKIIKCRLGVEPTSNQK